MKTEDFLNKFLISIKENYGLPSDLEEALINFLNNGKVKRGDKEITVKDIIFSNRSSNNKTKTLYEIVQDYANDPMKRITILWYVNQGLKLNNYSGLNFCEYFSPFIIEDFNGKAEYRAYCRLLNLEVDQPCLFFNKKTSCKIKNEFNYIKVRKNY